MVEWFLELVMTPAILSKKSTCIDSSHTMNMLREHDRPIIGMTSAEAEVRADRRVLEGSKARSGKKVRFCTRRIMHLILRFQGRVMRYESDSDSSRRRASNRQISKRENTNIVPCSDLCNDNPYKPRSDSKDNDSDWDEYSSEEEKRKEKKARNRKLIAAGLASITTVAAANNIYQSSKAHKARRRLVSEGRMCTSELKRQKTNAIMLDLFSVGVAAIGVNNAVNGWKSMENQRREHHKAYERHIEKREYHEQKLLTGPDMPRVPQLGWDRREEVYVR